MENELTIDQRRALALASARARAANQAQAATEKPMDPTAGMSRTERVLANIGAGMADIGLGARGLYADMFGSDKEKRAIEEEVAEKRALDERLAESTGGGKALQIAGNIIPSMAIPALPLATGASRLAIAGGGALSGALSGALMPRGQDESRGMNVGTGSVLGAAVPSAIFAARTMAAPFMGKTRAASDVAEAIIPEGVTSPQRKVVLQQAMQRAQQSPQTGTSNIPLSVAARLSSPELARLEAGSRARSGANWYDFDQAQAKAVSDEVMAATRGAQDIDIRRAMRSKNREVLFRQAMGTINEPAFARDLAGLRSNLEVATRTPEASNPAVRKMLGELASEIDRLGDDFRPEHLAEIRANLASKAPLVPTNAYQAAPRESPATMSVLKEVDNILNNATGGRWSPVLQAYKRDSDIVRSSQAAGKVRDAFIDPSTGRVLGVSADAAGDVPKITEAGLGRVLNTARGPRKELVLDPTVNTRLESVLNALRAQNIVQGVKRSATAGGGSNTASDIMAARTAQAAGDAAMTAIGGQSGQLARGLLSGIRGAVDARKDRALAEALQDEQKFVELMQRQAAQEGGVMDRSEVVRLLRRLKGTP